MAAMTRHQPSNQSLQFLKLGGSLITDKGKPQTARHDVIARLAAEIKLALETTQGFWLLLGHGSGSFGHVAAEKYQTRQGVQNPEEWKGFVSVWREARLLNQVVMGALHSVGLPAVAFPASSCAIAQGGRVSRWDIQPIRAAFSAGLLPVVYGDVVFDRRLGGTILSTEDIFSYLASKFRPTRILLAGMEAGVWADYPHCTRLIPKITPENDVNGTISFSAAAGHDVTGGMASKVQGMLSLVTRLPGLEAIIFSGEQEGNLLAALQSIPIGTCIRAEVGESA